MFRESELPADLGALRVLAIGTFGEPELQVCLRDLITATTTERLTQLGGGPTHMQTMAANYDLVVLAQSRPGIHDPELIHELRQRFPLTPIIVLLGSWCEGERRTGTPLQGTHRIFWYQWDVVLHEYLPLLASGRSGRGSAAPVPAAPSGTVAIHAADYDAGCYLAAALHTAGLATVNLSVDRLPQLHGIPVLVCDLRRGADDREILCKYAARYPEIRLVALCGFLRDADRQQLIEAGAATILNKPLEVNQLIRAVQELLPAAESTPSLTRPNSAAGPLHLPFPAVESRPAATRARRA